MLEYRLFTQLAKTVLQTRVPDRIIITVHIQAKTWNHLNVSDDVHVSISTRFLIFSKVIDKSFDGRVTYQKQINEKNIEGIVSLAIFHVFLGFFRK